MKAVDCLLTKMNFSQPNQIAMPAYGTNLSGGLRNRGTGRPTFSGQGLPTVPMNLRSIDLNLLLVFEALMAERSVTRAAEKVGVSQSAMSHGLRRLRATFNDDLVTRTPHGLIPTRRALSLVDPIRAALRQIQCALGEQLEFDPKTSERLFKIQFSYYMTGRVLPRLCERVRTEAPGVKLVVDHLPSGSGLDLDDPGNIQIRVSTGISPSPDYKQEPLFDDRFVVIMRADHPAAHKKMTPELFGSLTYVTASLPPSGSEHIEQFLSTRGLSRRIAMEISNPFWLVPVVQRTDVCAVVPERWVEPKSTGGDIAVVPLPTAEDRFTVEQFWHIRNDRDPGHRWLRQVITAVCREDLYTAMGPSSRRPQSRAARSEGRTPDRGTSRPRCRPVDDDD